MTCLKHKNILELKTALPFPPELYIYEQIKNKTRKQIIFWVMLNDQKKPKVFWYKTDILTFWNQTI